VDATTATRTVILPVNALRRTLGLGLGLHYDNSLHEIKEKL